MKLPTLFYRFWAISDLVLSDDFSIRVLITEMHVNPT